MKAFRFFYYFPARAYFVCVEGKKSKNRNKRVYITAIERIRKNDVKENVFPHFSSKLITAPNERLRRMKMTSIYSELCVHFWTPILGIGTYEILNMYSRRYTRIPLLLYNIFLFPFKILINLTCKWKLCTFIRSDVLPNRRIKFIIRQKWTSERSGTLSSVLRQSCLISVSLAVGVLIFPPFSTVRFLRWP